MYASPPLAHQTVPVLRVGLSHETYIAKDHSSADTCGACLKLDCARTQNVTLSPIHYRAVQRIYGEHGQQMVKLVRENPAYAIPIVFKRLNQKDLEWCAVFNIGQGHLEIAGPNLKTSASGA